MQYLKRFFALILALVIIVGATACNLLENLLPPIGKSPTPELSSTASPKTPEAVITPIPTRDPSTLNEAQKQLAALDIEIFEEYVTSDPLSFKLALKYPENFNFKTPENTWGDYTFEAALMYAQMESGWLYRLNAIDRDALSFDEQFTYDTLKQYLELSVESAQYFYYFEPLTPYNGIHTNMPLNFALYPIDNSNDVENYLDLLENTPRFMGKLLEFEREKSKQGLFMVKSAFDKLLEQLDEFISVGDDCFLFGTFEEALGKLEGVSADKLAEYAERNEHSVKALITSYKELRTGLMALEDTCSVGIMLAFGDEGSRAFELGLKAAACSDITPDQAYDIIYDELINEYYALMSAVQASPDIFNIYGTIDLDLGDIDENLSYLKKLTANYYPPIPQHTVRFLDVPKELEIQFPPAAYLMPPVDSTEDNLIIINRKSMQDSTDLLPTLAHEGYPGHMYHYLYVRSLLAKTGYTRQALQMTGYAESLSSYGTMAFARYNTKFSNDYCLMMAIDSNISNTLMPALCAIGVHYYEWMVDDIVEFLATFFGEESAKAMAAFYYDFCLNDPFYTLEYAIGFSILSAKQREAAKILGSAFDLLEFNKTFLDLGPSYFNLINERLDEWIERVRS